MLEKSDGLFPSRFESGTTEAVFFRLLSAFNTVLGVDSDDEGNACVGSRVLNQDRVLFTNTVDHLIPVNEAFLAKINIPTSSEEDSGSYRIRASYPYLNGHNTGYGHPMEVIWKKKLFVLDFYTGENSQETIDESADICCLDIRIAVNLEYRIPVHIELPRPICVRRRKRVSYPILGKFRIDTTQVETRNQTYASYSDSGRKPFPAETGLYEIEVELNPQCLMKALEKKLRGDPHHLYQLLQDFLNLLLDMSAYVASTPSSSSTAKRQFRLDSSDQNVMLDASPLQITKNKVYEPLIDLSVNSQPQELLDQYTTRIGNVYPLIGDYLYRAVAPVKELFLTGSFSADAPEKQLE